MVNIPNNNSNLFLDDHFTKNVIDGSSFPSYVKFIHLYIGTHFVPPWSGRLPKGQKFWWDEQEGLLILV